VSLDSDAGKMIYLLKCHVAGFLQNV